MCSTNVRAGEPIIERCRAGRVEVRFEMRFELPFVLNEEETFGTGILPSPLLVGQNARMPECQNGRMVEW